MDNALAFKRFLASLRFEHRSKLDQLGIEISSFEQKVDQ